MGARGAMGAMGLHSSSKLFLSGEVSPESILSCLSLDEFLLLFLVAVRHRQCRGVSFVGFSIRYLLQFEVRSNIVRAINSQNAVIVT